VSSKPRKAFDGVGRPAGIIDDVFGPVGKKAVQRVTKMAEKAAVAKRQDEKSWAKYQRTGSAYDNFKSQNARSFVAEEFIAKQKNMSLKDARKMVQNKPAGVGYARMLKDTDRAISESRKVVDARKTARKVKRATKRSAK
jgi:hypothetical protein